MSQSPGVAEKSASQLLRQKQHSKGRALTPSSQSPKAPPKGGLRGAAQGPNPKDNLNPILPPLYPTANLPTALRRDVSGTVMTYNNFASYFKSNFSVCVPKRNESGFYLDRYTDQYRSPLALKPHLVQKIVDKRYPDELNKKTVLKLPAKKTLKRKIEDLPDTDEVEKDGPAEKKPRVEEEEEEEKEEKEPVDEDLEDVEDEDEEMDQGTDYALSYFDNGEGDDDDGDEENGPTY